MWLDMALLDISSLFLVVYSLSGAEFPVTSINNSLSENGMDAKREVKPLLYH